MTLRVDVRGLGDVLFVTRHRETRRVLHEVDAENRLLPICDGLGASVVVCGHTHMQFDRIVEEPRREHRSVGMPFANPCRLAVARTRRAASDTPYDLAKAERIRATRSVSRRLAARHVLQPTLSNVQRSARDLKSCACKHVQRVRRDASCTRERAAKLRIRNVVARIAQPPSLDRKAYPKLTSGPTNTNLQVPNGIRRCLCSRRFFRLSVNYICV